VCLAAEGQALDAEQFVARRRGKRPERAAA